VFATCFLFVYKDESFVAVVCELFVVIDAGFA